MAGTLLDLAGRAAETVANLLTISATAAILREAGCRRKLDIFGRTVWWACLAVSLMPAALLRALVPGDAAEVLAAVILAGFLTIAVLVCLDVYFWMACRASMAFPETKENPAGA